MRNNKLYNSNKDKIIKKQNINNINNKNYK